MEEIFPILLALTVAAFAWGITALVLGAVKGERQRLTERLTGTSGTTGGPAASSGPGGASRVAHAGSDHLPPALARFAVMRSLQRQLVHAFPEMSVTRFLGLSAGFAAGAGLVAIVLWDSGVMAGVSCTLGG